MSGTVLQQPFASIDSTQVVASTSFGGTSDAGTTITVKPQVAEGDLVVLDYTVAISSFVGESTNAALPPPRQENSLSSIVTVPDGFAVVIGGLELESESQAQSQVPILGDLPLLEHLFQSRSDSSDRTRFWVFLRASVMHGERFEDLRWRSQPDLQAAGIDDGIPRVAPRIMR